MCLFVRIADDRGGVMLGEPVVFLVDDDPAIRVALERLLRSAGHVVVPCASASELLSSTRLADGGCLVLDLRMPERSGLEVQADLARVGVTMPIVFLTAFGDVQTTVRALKSGAADFLEKPVDADVLLAAVASACERDAAARQATLALADARRRVASLSTREREVFVSVAEGKQNKVIAADLGISEKTVKFHRARVTEKLGLRSSAQLARVAEQLGIAVRPPVAQD
jgi:FixJ family two-component response regulator